VTSYGIIPHHTGCGWCRETPGWRTVADADGYLYDEPCPNGCPQPELPPVTQDQDEEARFYDRQK
jgi:hypothetical protein